METLIYIIIIGGLGGFLGYLYSKKQQEQHDLKEQLQKLQQQSSNQFYKKTNDKKYQDVTDVAKVTNTQPDVKKQIQDVTNESIFSAKKPINGEAVKYFYIINGWIERQHPDWYLSFEVCMGAFIKTEGNTSSAYNSKRVDFLIINNKGEPKCVIEYHGSGHYGNTEFDQENADDRMKVKKIVLEKANIPLIEIPYAEKEHQKEEEKTKLLQSLSNLS